MTNASRWIGGAAIGSVVMYALDPTLGRRRRAILRDKMKHYMVEAQRTADVTSRDMFNRGRGLFAEIRHTFAGGPDDDVLLARVRSALGRSVANQSAISITATQGHLTLSGPVLKRDEARLIRVVRAVRGVRAVENRLESHDSAEEIPALQGAAPDPFQDLAANWPPATRLVVAAGGCGLIVYGVKRGGVLGSVLALAGTGLCARSIANIEMKTMLGVGGSYPPVEIQKAITISAPVHQVFHVWSDYANFPRLMSHVLAVADLGEGRSRWTVEGPGGFRFEWNAAITELVPDRLLKWRSEPGAVVRQAGIVRFEPVDSGAATRVHLRLSYTPPAGVAGHAFATFFTSDLKREIAEDLLRMKASIETGLAWQEAAHPQNSGQLDE